MSEGYHKHLKQHLPETFEELKTPVAITSTAWANEYDAYARNTKNARALVSTTGGLHEAIIASSAAMTGPGCPNCLFGFKAKKHQGHSVVTDGADVDPDGTAGLVKLAKCDRVVHMYMQDYQHQFLSPLPHEVPNKPKHLVTIDLHQPLSATYAYGTKDDQTRHSEASWSAKMYEVSYHAMNMLLDR